MRHARVCLAVCLSACRIVTTEQMSSTCQAHVWVEAGERGAAVLEDFSVVPLQVYLRINLVYYIVAEYSGDLGLSAPEHRR